MENILVYYVDEKAPTFTMKKLTGGIIAVIVVVSLIVLAGLLVLVSVCIYRCFLFYFFFSLLPLKCILVIKHFLLFQFFLARRQKAQYSKAQVGSPLLHYPNCGISLKEASFFNTFPSLLAGQRDGDHVLKILMMSHVLESDTGTCPMLMHRPVVTLHVTLSYWGNSVTC